MRRSYMVLSKWINKRPLHREQRDAKSTLGPLIWFFYFGNKYTKAGKLPFLRQLLLDYDAINEHLLEPKKQQGKLKMLIQ